MLQVLYTGAIFQSNTDLRDIWPAALLHDCGCASTHECAGALAATQAREDNMCGVPTQCIMRTISGSEPHFRLDSNSY